MVFFKNYCFKNYSDSLTTISFSIFYFSAMISFRWSGFCNYLPYLYGCGCRPAAFSYAPGWFRGLWLQHFFLFTASGIILWPVRFFLISILLLQQFLLRFPTYRCPEGHYILSPAALRFSILFLSIFSHLFPSYIDEAFRRSNRENRHADFPKLLNYRSLEAVTKTPAQLAQKDYSHSA